MSDADEVTGAPTEKLAALVARDASSCQRAAHARAALRARSRRRAAVPDQLLVQHRPQAFDHQLLDRGLDALALDVAVEHEADAHARAAPSFASCGSTTHCTLPLSTSGSARFGTPSLNTKSVPISSGRSVRDERAAAADVLRVVGEERVQALVLDAQLDRRSRRVPAVVAVHRNESVGRGEQAGQKRRALLSAVGEPVGAATPKLPAFTASLPEHRRPRMRTYACATFRAQLPGWVAQSVQQPRTSQYTHVVLHPHRRTKIRPKPALGAVAHAMQGG